MASDIQTATSSKYEILREVVKDYPGILSSTEPLLNELNNHPKKWGTVVKEMRTYAMKNFYLHDHHEKGIEAVSTIIDVLLEAITLSDIPVQHAAIDCLLFYLEKIVLDCEDIKKYNSVLNECFTNLNNLPENQFFLLITNPHQLKKLGQIILTKMTAGFDFEKLNNLLYRSLLITYKYWLNVEDPVNWFKTTIDTSLGEKFNNEIEESIYSVSHDNFNSLILHLESIKKLKDQSLFLEELLKLPGFLQLVKFYEDITSTLPHTDDIYKDFNLKVSYLLKILETNGLSSIHESTFREINRTISNAIKNIPPYKIKDILSETFAILKNSNNIYPEAALYCIQGIGNEIFNLNDSNLVEWYIQKIIPLGFQYPNIKGATDEWQVKSNHAHLENIRVWLELIENNPKWSKSLVSALIINITLGGIHISDTDLFQKDITKLLNSDIKPVYYLIKQLAKLFPAYFSEIGAEGALREVSTELDEINGRSDLLVHFLRKQSHVESSARVVSLIEEIIKFWLTRDKASLKEFLPEDIYPHVGSSGIYIDELNIIFSSIFNSKGISNITDLLNLKEDDFKAITDEIPSVSEKEKKRALLTFKFYKLLDKKYKLDPRDIKDQLKNAQGLGLPNTELLINILEKGNVYERLEGILGYLQLLKDIILSPERYEAVENIFRKRHIAAGIPSMYGSYHERKFDALSLTFRLENYANILFEELINSINLKFITRASLFQINKFIKLFFTAMQLDGISSSRLENTLELLSVALEVRRFTFTQYIDIFRSFSEAVQDIVNTYYSGIHKNNLRQIILQLGSDKILPKYLVQHDRHSDFELINMVTEAFLRDFVSSSFGLQQLDNFVIKILKTLFKQAEDLDIQNLDLLMSYDPKKALSSIYTPNKATYDRIHLGNKGYNLIRMSSLDISVPPGFIITSEVFRCRQAINKFRFVSDNLNEKINKQISELERVTGKKFGCIDNPLLVSIRSGGAISLPGMMISFLNVGINEDIVSGLIKQTGKPWFVWDCYRRFLQGWGMSFGIERDRFDYVINSFKNKYKVPRKIQFTPEQMREIALAYRKIIKSKGIEVVDDPRIQLETAISQVFQSWFSKKAHDYREILGLSENWGTAVIVQAMVYGNLDINSGTGVLFTRNPKESGDRVMLWGDFALRAQGEDIVSGLIKTLPLSKEQQDIEERTQDISLEESFPEIYNMLLKIVKDLIYKERWGAQEIEFTFEDKDKDKLYILQARDMSIRRTESFMAFVPSKELYLKYLSNGIGVGGGALSGRVVFDLNGIKEFREKDPDTPLILIRSDTVPDDIRHISESDGLLTARGGSTSHAAIIANRLGKTCVVGCNNLIVSEHEKKCKFKRRTLKEGDYLSIDGRNGSVYMGRHQVKEIRISA